MRTKVLALLATAMVVVGIGVLPSLALAATPEGGVAATAEAEAGVRGGPFDVESFVISECPAATVCFWSGKTFGRGEVEPGLNAFSFFNGFETGCHALANINPQSVFNHTGEHLAVLFVGIFGEVELGISPGETFQFGSRYTRGFCMR